MSQPNDALTSLDDPQTLGVYYDGSTYVVARDINDAVEVFKEQAGYLPYQNADDPPLELMDERSELPIWWDLAHSASSQPGEPCVRRIRLTLGEWKRVRGRGFLCSEDF